MSSSLPPSATTPYSHPIGSLRAWITLLVVAHHSVLAYHSDAPPMPASLDGGNRIWGAFPIVDSARFPLFGLFTWANEMYFMALMFLLSGLFVWPALQRKGAGAYVRDRVVRLGIPFVIAAGLLAPLAYHVTWLQMGGTGGWGAFWAVWTKPGVWTSGPAWFLWVLLSFDLVVAAITAVAPGWGDAAGRLAARLTGPGAFFGALFGVASVAYLILELPLGGLNWWTWGPFSIQGGRVLLYFAYFLFGIALGARPLQEGVLAEDGALARQWKRWANIAGIAFVVVIVAIIAAFSARPLRLPLHVATDLAYTLSGAAFSLAMLSLFLRFARGRNAFFAALAPCAYGVYLLHYPVVTHLQYALLGVTLPGLAKALIVTAGAIAISWGITAALRRVPGVARVL
ncbi:MAG: acyltransferase [Candidatus Eisenbacteria bacterium]|nr:acyltransferase [Candidatus Eisenbacteria bacterium]